MSTKQQSKPKAQRAQRVAASTATPAPQGEAVIETTDEEQGPSRTSRALEATSRGLHKTGVAVIDFDLRKVGQSSKRLGRFIKSHTPRVRIERPEASTEA